MMTSCGFLAHTESARAMVQLNTPTATMIANARVRAKGSIPPKSELMVITGQEQATRPNTGSSRAPSLPRTISASERSVTRM